MHVGLTYNLKGSVPVSPDLPADFDAEFDSEQTIAAVEHAVECAGYTPVRIGGLQDLVDYLHSGKTVDLVFNMAEGIRGRSREAQIPALLEAYGIPYTFSDPLTLALCLDKAMTKRIWIEQGLPTAPYFVATSDADVLDSAINFPLFVKPAHEGSSKGIDQESVVYDLPQLHQRINWLVKTYQEPALVESFLSGAEYTVGLIGNNSHTQVLGIVEITAVRQYPVNGYQQKEHGKNRPDVFVPLAKSDYLYNKLSELALSAFHAVNCRDAARIDIRLDKDGQPNLLELNPIAGMHPTHSALPAIAYLAGMTYEDLVGAILGQARLRIEKSDHNG
jgi:D-alanine-D-alanine ligase